MIVLDTDLLSLLERDDPAAARLSRRLAGVEATEVFTTIVNFEYVTGEGPSAISRKDSIRVRKDGLDQKVLLSRELERTLYLMLNPPTK